MNYQEFKVPYISDDVIRVAADRFRKKYWGDVIPVNIESIIEEKLAMEIIPIPDLKKHINTDAFISSDWQSVYVDNEKYMEDSYYNRLRFSIAHEIGHYVLHQALYEELKINSLSDFSDFLNNISGKQYGYIETQANKFANYFLVPRNILKKERVKIMQDYNEITSLEEKLINSYIATPLSKKFGVSSEVMEIALNTENY